MSSVIFLIVVTLSVMNAVAQSGNDEPELISEELEERTNRKIKRESFGEVETYRRRLLDQFTSLLEPTLRTKGSKNIQKYKHYFRTMPAGQRDTSKIINRKTENEEIKNFSFPPLKQFRQGFWPGFTPDETMPLDMSTWQNQQVPSQFSSQFSSPFFPQLSLSMPQNFQPSLPPLSPLTQQGFPSMMGQPFSSSLFNKPLSPFPQSPTYSSPFMPQMEQYSSF